MEADTPRQVPVRLPPAPALPRRGPVPWLPLAHAALCVGVAPDDPQRRGVCEADGVDGTRAVGLHEFVRLHLRLCRPIVLRVGERLEIRRPSVFVLRDFDVWPCLQAIEPGLDGGFDPHRLKGAVPQRSEVSHVAT
jgi:hypothetical protein